MAALPVAAVVTVGTELTTGLRQDTNGTEVARALAEAGYDVRTIISLPDDPAAVSDTLRMLTASYSLVAVTGGLGPTHDDITRDAAAEALGRPLQRDDSIADKLRRLAVHHGQEQSRVQMLRQADIIEGATVLPAVTGSAPGQAVDTPGGTLLLLPGPPAEMRPILHSFLSAHPRGATPVRLRCTRITESDAQHLVAPAIAGLNVDLTLLAAPGDIEVVIFPRAGDARDLERARIAARAALGDACYSDDGSTLAEVVLRLAAEAGEQIVCAESCTGGLVAAALTDVSGASAVFRGGVVAYDNEIKTASLGVPAGLLAQYGAVSEETARAMAEGALALPGSTISVAVTGVAGPTGGTPDKPVGLVWFAVARADGRVVSAERHLGGDRATVRRRATTTALDLLRLEILRG